MDYIKEAYRLLKDWKGDSYIFGLSVLDKIGEVASRFGQKALLVSNTTYMKPSPILFKKKAYNWRGIVYVPMRNRMRLEKTSSE